MAGEVAGEFAEAIAAEASQDERTRSTVALVRVTPSSLDRMVSAPTVAYVGSEIGQQFVAVGVDQFGNRIAGLDLTWSVEAGGGTIDPDGLFTAGSKPGVYEHTVKASATEGPTESYVMVTVVVEPERIAFTSDRHGELFDIYLMNSDGSDVLRLTDDGGVYPAWSPDGRRLVHYFCGEAVCFMYLINDDGSWEGFASGSDAFWPSWSPDGSKIAFVSDRDGDYEIFVMDVDAGNERQLTNNNAADSNPSWSPDAGSIVFDSDRDGNGEIYVMEADGSNQVPLTDHPADDCCPAWSPDGKEIAFESIRDGDWEVHALTLADGSVRQLTSNPAGDGIPAWSADGSQILFVSDRDGDFEVYIMDRAGGGRRRLTRDPAVDAWAAWAPVKQGVDVSEASIVVEDSSVLAPSTVQDVTRTVRGAVVRIETDVMQGSGFAIDPDGLILTNSHVISGATDITVFFEDGTSYAGTVEARDPVADLAVVKIEAEGIPYLELGDASQLSLGSQVLVIGYPDTVYPTVTSGLASSFIYDQGRNINWIQTDSAINPGNSGGPIVNLQGQVVGVVTRKQFGLEGVGFAISANTAKLYLGLAFVARGDEHMRADDYNLAIAAFTQALTLDPTSVDAHVSRSWAYRALWTETGSAPDKDQAVADATKAIEIRPRSSALYNHGGLLHWYNHELLENESALIDYATALELKEEASIYNNRALAYATMGSPEPAIADANRALELSQTNNSFIYDTRGYVYLKAGEYEKAKADYDELFSQGGESSYYLLGGGLAYAGLGDTERALELLQQGLEQVMDVKAADPQLADLIAMAEDKLAELQ